MSHRTSPTPTVGSAAPGLSTAEACRRLREFGPNRPVSGRRRSTPFAWVARTLSDPMVILLLVAGFTAVTTLWLEPLKALSRPG